MSLIYYHVSTPDKVTMLLVFKCHQTGFSINIFFMDVQQRFTDVKSVTLLLFFRDITMVN
jgi:hypothetical protein